MKLISNLILSVAFLIHSLTSTAQTANSALTNLGVIDMHKSGLGADVILTSIESSVCKFNVTPTGLIALKKSGVDESVIKAMIEKQSGKPAPSKSVSTASTDKKTSEVSANNKTEKKGSLTLLNHVYLSTSATGAQPLEKLVAGIRTKTGMMGGKILLQVEGDKSALRINSDDIGGFLINTGSDILPELVLYKLKVVKGKREVATMTASSFGGLKTGEAVITLNISKDGNGIYKITPGTKLEAGEYFFTGKPSQGSSTADAFAFGVN